MSSVKKPLLEELLVVMVLYQQDLLQSLSYQTLTRALVPTGQKPSLLVYDNSLLPQSVESDSIPWKVMYIHNPTNPGVSKAYNEAFQYARSLPGKWMLLVDQDTTFPLTVFSEYEMAVEAYPSHPLFAPVLLDDQGQVSPFLFRAGKGTRVVSKTLSGIHSLKQFKVINSGLLVSVQAFHQVNGFDERFPLDYSDIVFQDRLLSFYSEFVVTSTVCQHLLSSSATRPATHLLARFEVFCRAASLYKRMAGTRVNLGRIILLRSLKLFVQTLNPKFLTTGISALFAKA